MAESEYGDEMKLSDDGKYVGRDGQHSDGFDDCTFWYGWKWQPIDEWLEWVDKITDPEMLDFGEDTKIQMERIKQHKLIKSDIMPHVS